MRRIILFLLVIVVAISQIAFASGHIQRYRDMTAQTSPFFYKTTPATTLTYYLSENFESTNFPPSGWAQIITNYDFTWTQSDSYFGIIYPHSGNYMAYVDWDYAQQEGLITPSLNFSTASSNLHLTFSWQANYAYMVYPSNNANYQLWISTDSGFTWADLLWAEDSIGVFDNRVWYTTTIDLGAYAGQSEVRLCWLYTGSDADAVFLDDIFISDDSLAGPVNDNCEDITPVALTAGSSWTFAGSNVSATNDCDSLEYSQVWVAFTTTQYLDIVIDYCGMPTGWGNYSGILVEGCPCGSFYDYSWLSVDSCADHNITMGFGSIPPGTYYYPVILDSSSSAIGDYSIHVAASLYQGSGDCQYLIGDISGDNQRLGGDVTYGVRFFKGTGSAPPDSCYLDSTGNYLYVAGDCNGNCEFRGSDITRLVAYFKGNARLSCCHFFPTTIP